MKPTNILVTTSTEDTPVKLGQFLDSPHSQLAEDSDYVWFLTEDSL